MGNHSPWATTGGCPYPQPTTRYPPPMHRRLPLLVFALVVLVGCQAATPVASPRSPEATTARPSATAPVTAAASSQQLLVMPDDGVAPVLDLIRSARRSIRFKIYLLTHKEVMAELVRAANRGVDVRVIIEKEPTGGGESNQEASDLLREGGVAVQWAPADRYRLTHEKSLVVDDSKALISTFNYTRSSFSGNREYGLLTTKPSEVAEVAAVFDADWNGAPYEPAEAAMALSPVNSRVQIEGLIDGAKKTLWLEQSSLLDDAITERLAATARRGVDVRFIGPLREGEDDFSEPNLKQLAAAGVKVGRLPDPLVHAKVILADDRLALIGSINLTYSSLDLNRELGLITSDAGVLQRLGATLAADWKKAQPLQPAPTGVIPWQQAGDHIGAEVTVEGDIVRTRDTGSVIYLNFDENYRGKLSIVIFSKSAARFPEPPAAFYLNQRVRVTGAVKEYQGAPEIVVDSPAQIEVMDGAAGNERSLGVDVSGEALTPIATAPVAVTWQEAAQYVGQRITVTGRVVRTHDTGKVTFLNFTDDWRGTFSVVVFASDYDRFPSPPVSLYLDQNIQVTGTIKEYEGSPEIIVESPPQIEVIAENGATPAQTPSPDQTPTAASRTAPLLGVAPWRQAADYVGHTATVEGVITDTFDTGKITFLNFSPKHDVFVAVVFAEDYGKFPLPPAKLYKGKKVWITGEVTDYRGTAQIIVHGPDQIEVFE